MGRWFGLTDRETARAYGLLVPDTAATDIDEANETLGEDPSFRLTLTGTAQAEGSPDANAPTSLDGVAIPEGGCDGEASRALGQDNVMNLGDSARDLMFSSSGDFQKSASYQELQKEWAACMKTAGYPQVNTTYNDAFATKLPAARTEAKKPTTEEIDFALQSIDCMEKVDLQQHALKLRAGFDQNLREQHQLELQENRTRMDEQVRKATEEIEKAGGFQ